MTTVAEVADMLAKHGGVIGPDIPGMGRIYMGTALIAKFNEVFGRDPTDSEYWCDWYDCDFDRLSGKGNPIDIAALVEAFNKANGAA
jgi:hypothetical protein